MEYFASNPFQCNILQTHTTCKPFKTSILARRYPPGGRGASPRRIYNHQSTIRRRSESCRSHRPRMYHPYRQQPSRTSAPPSSPAQPASPPSLPTRKPRPRSSRQDPGPPLHPDRRRQILRRQPAPRLRHPTATDRTVNFAVVAARQAAAESQLTNTTHRKKSPSWSAAPAVADRPKRPRPPSSTPATPASIPSPSSAPWPPAEPATSPSTSRSPGPRHQHLHRLLLRRAGIGLAFQMIRSGMIDAAITGGHEAPLTFGFLAPGTACASSPPPSAAPSPPTATA